MRQVLLTVDVVVTPTMPKPAPTMEDAVNETRRRSGPFFTMFFNQVGLPSLSVPSGFTDAGLPTSLMISGRPFEEATVLRIGHAYRKRRPGTCATPRCNDPPARGFFRHGGTTMTAALAPNWSEIDERRPLPATETLLDVRGLTTEFRTQRGRCGR